MGCWSSDGDGFEANADGSTSFVANRGCEKEVWDRLEVTHPGADLSQVVHRAVLDGVFEMLWHLRDREKVPACPILEVASQVTDIHARCRSGRPSQGGTGSCCVAGLRPLVVSTFRSFKEACARAPIVR